MTIEECITEEVQARIELAVHTAELGTSGEVRVHLENECKEEVLDRASYIFSQLEMHKTDLRNGVLIYAALKDKKLAIIGDAGIHEKLGDKVWEDIKVGMLKFFRQDKIEEGLTYAIQSVGEKIKVLFPFATNDRNELPNALSFGKDKNNMSK